MTEDARLPVEAIVEEVLKLHPSGWTLAEHTTKTILRLGGLGHVIVVGRGGNVITARLPNVFHVRLVAPLAMRIKHTAEYYQLNDEYPAVHQSLQAFAPEPRLRRYLPIACASGPAPFEFGLFVAFTHQLLRDGYFVVNRHSQHTPAYVLGRFVPDGDLRGLR